MFFRPVTQGFLSLRQIRPLALTSALAMAALLGSLSAAQAQENCANRGDPGNIYCDANKDMVADTPNDLKKLKNPSTLVFTCTPVEDPAVYENIYKPFTGHLGQCKL
jgi:phosphonate transport system substrate-binding protein